MKETRLLNIAKSLVVILTLSLILTPNPNAPAAPKSRAIKLSSVGGRRAKPGIVKGGKMRLAGQHTFTVTNGKKVTWTLDREEANEEGGTPTLLKNVASAKGATAIFDLTKTSDKETVYHVRAQGDNFSDTFSGQVFPHGKRSSFTYRSVDNPDVRTYVVVPATLSPATKVVMGPPAAPPARRVCAQDFFGLHIEARLFLGAASNVALTLALNAGHTLTRRGSFCDDLQSVPRVPSVMNLPLSTMCFV
ncbi:MAG: hypothetical protein M3458_08915 [Acidobacteriota bacterium]|nr:hypothetical protein [Acidobacteriota bacterium]